MNNKLIIRLFVVVIVAMFLLVSGCTQTAPSGTRAIYYWRSGYSNLSDEKRNFLNELSVNKLYVKYFEVEYNKLMGTVPVSKNRFSTYSYNRKDSFIIIPTVYIHNDVLQNNDYQELDTLAANILFLIDKFNKENYPQLKPTEYQIDCDWTLSTKDKYFHLLKKIKAASGKTISCTLRLYPYKFRKEMGVPPVDRVMLMCYNLLNPLENKDKNGILEVDELNKYMAGATQYPLPVDVALPVYSWILAYQNNKFSKIIYNNHAKILEKADAVKPLWYRMKEDIELEDIFLRTGDMIKYETVSTDDLDEAIKIIKKHIQLKDETTIALFHLDSKQLEKYSYEEINHIYKQFP